jgi:hypothetical protein
MADIPAEAVNELLEIMDKLDAIYKQIDELAKPELFMGALPHERDRHLLWSATTPIFQAREIVGKVRETVLMRIDMDSQPL